MNYIKDHAVEILVIVFAVIALSLVWQQQKDKPEPVVPTLGSQLENAQ